MDKPMSNLAFLGMSLLFKIRDFIRPPMDKVMEIGLKPGARVLDYGCGPGSLSIEAARLVGESGTVFSVDMHPNAIESVKRRAAKEGLTNIVPIEANSPDALETESFDVVILYDIFHDFGNPEMMLRELHRVLKPDGTLSFSDHHMNEAAILSGVTRGGLFKLSKKGNRTYSFRKVKQDN